MENRMFKHGSAAVARKDILKNIENKAKQLNGTQDGPVNSKQIRRTPSRTLSVASDENVGAGNKMDINAWEDMTRKIMRNYCFTNGIDIAQYLIDEVPKKTKGNVSHRLPPQNAIYKIVLVFNGLDLLMSQKGFSAATAVELLDQLALDYFVNKCARYWSLRANVAVTLGDYKLALNYLDRAERCKAEPIMELLRAYQKVSHKMVDALGKTNGNEEAQAIGKEHDLNGNHQELLVDNDPERANNTSLENGNKMDDSPLYEENGGNEENTETEITILEMEDGRQVIPDHAVQLSPLSEQEESVELLADRSDSLQPLSPLLKAEGMQVEELAEPNAKPEMNGAKVVDETFEIEPVQKDQNTSINESIPNGVQAIAYVSPKVPTSRPRNKSPFDQDAVFESSTTKVLVFENKSTKKRNGDDGPKYTATPVRRSTRKAVEFNKWYQYRSTTVDTPGDVGKLGISKNNLAFKDNKYLPSDEDSD